jgi:hypothetical protein
MSHRSKSKEVLQTSLAEIVGWQAATRDDRKVVLEIHQTRTVDQVHVLEEAAFFDEFFHYVREIGLWPFIEDLDPRERRGALYPFVRFVMVMMMRCVGGVKSMLATHDVLLTDESLMGIAGFNAVQVREGGTARGMSRRKQPVEVRGAISFETVADNIVRIGPEKLSAMFNGAIRCIAAQKVLAKNLDVVLDATDDEATPKYATDDGRPVPVVTREKRPDVRANRHAKKVEVSVWGWKVWIIWESQAKIPLAIVIDGINEPDNKHAYSVLRQAQENVAGHAIIRSVALDRGFLDGKLLYAIDRDGIVIYIPAKSNMTITVDAREIARRAAAKAAAGRKLEGCVYRERTERITHSSGRKAWTEERKTIVVGIRDLPCDWWGEEGYTSKANSKKFASKLISATVVLRWDGAAKEEDKEVVILTTDPSEDPFISFDAYDDRSLIENTCNREAKEHWFLEHHPKRSEAGVRAQAFFVLMCMALVAVFRMYKESTDEEERHGRETGISRYRRRLERQNRDKVAVFIDGRFGIMYAYELLLILGITVRDRMLMGESTESVLRKYGADVSVAPDTS